MPLGGQRPHLDGRPRESLVLRERQGAPGDLDRSALANDVMGGALPGEELEVLHERLPRRTCLDMRLVRDRHSLRAVHVAAAQAWCAGQRDARPDRERRNSRIGALTVDVDVVRDVRSARGPLHRIGEVVVHDERPERVRDDVDRRAARPLLQSGDPPVDLCVHRAPLRRTSRRVVVDFVDPGRRVAVAREAQLLRLELRARALDAVHEQDRMSRRRRIRARGSGQRQGSGGDQRQQRRCGPPREVRPIPLSCQRRSAPEHRPPDAANGTRRAASKQLCDA